MSVEPSSSAPARKPAVRLVAILGFAVLLAVLAGFAFAGRGKDAAAEPDGKAAAHAGQPQGAVPELAVETVSTGVLSQPIRVTGTLRTDETVTISTKATGLVRAVHAKEGDRVRRGQLLIVIDDSDLRAQRDRAVAQVHSAQAAVQQAEAAEKAARAKLEQARTSRDIKNVASQADYRQAEQALAAARTKLSQAQALSGIAGTESETRVQSAQAALQSVKERLKQLREGSRRQEKAAAEAAVARAQAQVARTKSQLDRREQLLADKAIAAEVVDNARRDYEVALTDLEAAKQQLSLVQEGPRTEEIRMAEEAVRQSEAALRDAEANRARRQVSNQDVENAQAAVRQAEAALEATRAALDQKDWNEEDIRAAAAALAQARATVLRERAAVHQAKADVRYQEELISQTRLYSPVNGVVTKRDIQVGAAVVQMRNELMTIVSSDTLYFEATAPETVMAQLRPGLEAKVSLDAFPGRTFPGLVREIIPVAEGTNRSVRLRISIPKTVQAAAVVGGFARAEVEGESRRAIVTVPRDAVVSDEGDMAVFLLQDGKAVRRLVKIGDPGGSGDRVPILDGLKGGETVIVEGASSLTEGQEIKVKGEGSGSEETVPASESVSEKESHNRAH